MGHERSVHSLPSFRKGMRTCWVIDHPAHFQLFKQWFQEDDILIVTKRQELDAMLAIGFTQEILRVPRVSGSFFSKFRTARLRQSTARRFLKLNSVSRIISKGAPFELRAAAKERISQRWYISDTEVNTIAHRLGTRSSSHILLPESWESNLKPTHTYPGILPQAYIDTDASISSWNSARSQIPSELGISADEIVVFHRKIIGNGVHDSTEIIDYEQSIRKMNVHFVENKENTAPEDGSAWEFPIQASLFDGVLTGSTTLAAEAVVQGVPTLLISKAKRGFLTYLSEQPHFFHWNNSDLFDGHFSEMAEQWKNCMKSTRENGRNPVPNPEVKSVLDSFFR